jgi:PAS domain S-box-containing protein
MNREDNTGIFRPGIEIERANLANLFRQTPEMVCILAGPEHRFEFVNAAHVRALGFDATGRTVRDAQPESVEIHTILDDVYRTGVTASLVEIPVTVTDRVRYFNLTYAARKNGRDQIDGIMILGSEVTDIVLAREAQENQRRWLETVLDRLPHTLYLLDPTNSRVMFENEAARKMMGFEAKGSVTAERQGEGKLRVFSGGRELTADEFPSHRSIRGEELRDEPFTFVVPAGKLDVRVSSTRFGSAFGQPETLLILVQDVSPLKRVESALRKSEEQLSSALSVSQVGFYDWDVPVDRVTFSDRMIADWGLPQDISPAPIGVAFDRMHPDDRVRVQAEIEASMANHTELRTDYRVVHPDGKTVWIEVRGQVNYNSDGVAVRIFGTSVDVTDWRRAEEALRKSGESLQALADSMPQVVWTARPDGELDYTNRRWTEYSGSSEPSRWIEAVHPDDVARVVATWTHSVTTGELYETEFRLRRQDGVYRWFLTRAVAMRGSTGAVNQWLGTCTDIEDQKYAESALRNANIAAESANSSKSAFLANMSHEIRTPLGAILGFIGLMKSPKASPKSMASYISVIERNSDHLLRIVDDILDLSKVEAGLMQIEKIEFSLPEILADVASIFGFRAREKAIEFDLSALSELPARVLSDPTRIRQILTNILGNAIKFTERGRIGLAIEYADHRIKFTVEDTGLGISEAQRANLFQPFTQADVSTTRKYGGTGLGLVLTRRLCEALGGEFGLVRSEIGVGSVFVATLHVDIPEPSEMIPAAAVHFAAATERRARIDQELAGQKILVVEDSPDNQILFRLILEEAGAEVTIAGDGLAGVEAAFAGNFDAVVMDIQMPKMDGHAAARELRRRNFSRPLIALTAHAMAEERERCRQSGFTDYLSKPVRHEELIARLKKPASSLAERIKIIFVEDDRDIRESLCELLTMEGQTVLASESAEEGLRLVSETPGPLLVVTDLSLPGMDGAEFVRRLNERSDRCRFRIVIASGSDDLPRRAREMGADGHVRKPFDANAFLELVPSFEKSFRT